MSRPTRRSGLATMAALNASELSRPRRPLRTTSASPTWRLASNGRPRHRARWTADNAQQLIDWVHERFPDGGHVELGNEPGLFVANKATIAGRRAARPRTSPCAAAGPRARLVGVDADADPRRGVLLPTMRSFLEHGGGASIDALTYTTTRSRQGLRTMRRSSPTLPSTRSMPRRHAPFPGAPLLEQGDERRARAAAAHNVSRVARRGVARCCGLAT